MKNIVLIITDTFRYDNLGSRARRPVRTPELDRFAAKKAVSIEKFYTGSFPTIPHRTDLASGVLGWPRYGWQPIDLSTPNHIASLLREKGYAAQLICDTPHLFRARFQYGFDAAFQHRGQEGDRYLLHLNDPIETVMPREKTRARPLFMGHPLPDLHRWMNRYFRCEEETFPAKTASTAVRWLEENWRFKPFFLWVDFFDPHEPWDPPEYFVKRYDPDYTGVPMIHPNYGLSSVYTPDELWNLWAHYAAEAELVDRYIGRILQKIDDLQLWDDTIVVVTSDHGTSLGEHGRTGKSNISVDDDRFWPIYPEIGHVPFLIAGGGLPEGKSLDIIAQPIDVLPTVCELAGVEIKPRERIQGRSFAGVILGEDSAHRRLAVSGAHLKPGGIPARATTPFLVTDKWGYAPVGAHGRPELYDLTRDPLAENDVSEDNMDVVKELHGLFVSHLREHGAPPGLLSMFEKAPLYK